MKQRTNKGLRNDFLEKAKLLSHFGGFYVPEFITLGFDLCRKVDSQISTSILNLRTLKKNTTKEWMNIEDGLIDIFQSYLTSEKELISNIKESLNEEKLLVRPTPYDEYLYPNISFAGVYKSFVPDNNNTNLIYASAKVLAGRFTRYADLYYNRHNINSKRTIGLMYMKPVNKGIEQNLIHGTAYCTKNHLRTEYVTRPRTTNNQSDPHILSIKNNTIQFPKELGDFESGLDFSARLVKCMQVLFDNFKKPLDVEYLFNPNGDLNIVQIRYISEKHLKNWKKTPFVVEEKRASAIINTVGTIEGKIFDCRNMGKKVEGVLNSNNIIVVDYKNNKNDYGVLDILEMLEQDDKNISLIVDHGNKRLRDHVQYVITEDPSVNFVFQTDDRSLLSSIKHDQVVKINSNGIYMSILT
ncbi:hypothetical protein GCM10011531_07140 [Aquaticitalea lipolytica]|uniref:Pyruvate, water dikinase n=1 Tax=Aquaticitalea lipolytica TaxID=1247562 RepID=A0A8J2TPI0_9FLAO|nr:hypothetical protein [Aquaticitalea lipolytica]GFZ79783.1 hypothetical protein GCM10011531_07140 [Aquaticitalea lipolytica]